MLQAKWNQILGWSPDLIHALRCDGYSFFKEGKYEQARLYFEALATLQPGELYDLRTLGSIYLYLGEAQKALTALNHALYEQTNHYPTLLNRTKALLLLGRRAEGLQAAENLKRCPIKEIADDASALIIAYSL
jgi:predicted Zn-dependent protease